jgi:PadR family transcriptional regulator PadR
MLLSPLDSLGEPTYGYDIARRITEIAPDDDPPRQGTLYPALRSLEKLGLLRSTIQPSVSGPPRKYYEPTDEGRAALPVWRDEWHRIVRFVDATLDLPHAPAPTPENDR